MKKGNFDLALDSFCSSYAKTMSTGGWGRWPSPYITTPETMMMIDPEFAKYFLLIIKKIEKKGLSYDDIAKKILYPSPLSRIFFISRALKVHNYPQDNLLKIINFISEVMARKYIKNHFCLNGKNILISNQDIKNRVNDKVFDSINPELKHLNGLLWLYAELIYMYFHNYGHEIHGPYPHGKHQLIIREWHSLKPPFFDFCKDFPSDNITIYELYDQTIDITFDISNRMNCSKPVDKHVKKFYVEINGRKIKDITKLNKKIEKHIAKAVKSFEKTNRKFLLPKIASIHFRVLKPFCEIVNMPYKPTKACLRRMREDKLTKYEESAIQKIKKMNISNPKVIRMFFDPRIPLKLN